MCKGVLCREDNFFPTPKLARRVGSALGETGLNMVSWVLRLEAHIEQ
jgi:hypothetical protein